MTEQEQTEMYLDTAVDLLIDIYERYSVPNCLKEEIEKLLIATDNYQYLTK